MAGRYGLRVLPQNPDGPDPLALIQSGIGDIQEEFDRRAAIATEEKRYNRQRALINEEDERAEARNVREHERRRSEANEDRQYRSVEAERERIRANREQGIIETAEVTGARAVNGIAIPEITTSQTYDASQDIQSKRSQAITATQQAMKPNPWELAGHQYSSEAEYMRALRQKEQIENRYRGITANQQLVENERVRNNLIEDATGAATDFANRASPQLRDPRTGKNFGADPTFADAAGVQGFLAKAYPSLSYGARAGIAQKAVQARALNAQRVGTVAGVEEDQLRHFQQMWLMARRNASTKGVTLTDNDLLDMLRESGVPDPLAVAQAVKGTIR